MWLRKRRENFIGLADRRTFRKRITLQVSFRLPSAPSLVAVPTYAVSFLRSRFTVQRILTYWSTCRLRLVAMIIFNKPKYCPARDRMDWIVLITSEYAQLVGCVWYRSATYWKEKFVFPTADYHNRVILKKINDDCVTRNQCFSFRSCIAQAMFGVCQRKASCCKKKKKLLYP